MSRKPYLRLLALTFAALLVHGYHPGVEDGEIYLPGIKKILNPALYPFGSEFFLNHARLTLFDELIAALRQHLDRDVLGDQVLFDQLANEIEIRL